MNIITHAALGAFITLSIGAAVLIVSALRTNVEGTNEDWEH